MSRLVSGSWWGGALVVLVAVAVLGVAPSRARAAAVTVTEFTGGLAVSPNPTAVAPGPDGNVWFTDNRAVGRITPAGVITEYTAGIPAGDTPANSITVGSDHALWFCLDGMNPAVGRIDPATGTITHFALSSDPQSVVEGPDGNVWFIGGAGMGTGAIGYITPAGKVTEITSGFSTANTAVEAIAPGPDGNIWFLDTGTPYSVGHVDLSKTPYALSETSTGIDPLEVLDDITAGPDGNVWFTAAGAIGKITLPAGTVTEVDAGNNGLQANAVPDEIMAGPGGNLWFDDQLFGAFSIGRIVPSSFSVKEFPLTAATTPWTFTIGSDGNIYVVQTGLVAQMTTTGTVTDFPTNSSMSGMDGDAMIQGPDGNVYYNDTGTPRAIVQVNLDEKPAVTTGAATAITASSATVSGSVTPLSAASTVTVRYGPTTALGFTAPAASLPASATAAAVSANLTALPAATTIYYEVVASNANGTTTGAVQKFTTAPPTGTSTTTTSTSTKTSTTSTTSVMTTTTTTTTGGTPTAAPLVNLTPPVVYQGATAPAGVRAGAVLTCHPGTYSNPTTHAYYWFFTESYYAPGSKRTGGHQVLTETGLTVQGQTITLPICRRSRRRKSRSIQPARSRVPMTPPTGSAC